MEEDDPNAQGRQVGGSTTGRGNEVQRATIAQEQSRRGEEDNPESVTTTISWEHRVLVAAHSGFLYMAVVPTTDIDASRVKGVRMWRPGSMRIDATWVHRGCAERVKLTFVSTLKRAERPSV